jgi:hypothetical protein
MYSQIIIQVSVLLISLFSSEAYSNSPWHYTLPVQVPFTITQFLVTNYCHNEDQNIMFGSLFQLQTVLGVTMMKCYVRVECQLKGISVNINICGISFPSSL